MEKLNEGAAGLGLELDKQQLEQFQTYYEELVAWNRHTNLTTITDYDGVQLRHFLDSLSVVLAWPNPLYNKEALSVIDIGSGAGLPGIPLKIALPEINLTLLEATAKKAAFLQHITNRLALSDVEVVTARAEEAAHDPRHRERFAIVLSRAVAALPVLAELVLPFCAIGGRFIAHKKGDIKREVESASKAITVLGGQFRESEGMTLPGLADGRYLIVVDKVSATPPQYPRRPGVPGKRPLA